MHEFVQAGRASVVFGGQFGSEGKGLVNAAVAVHNSIDLVTTNNGPNSGHTSVVNGVKRVSFHLPTATVVELVPCYLNDGAVIDVEVLLKEMKDNKISHDLVSISPSACVVTRANKDLEGLESSPMSKIASTRKGVGAALASKVLRSAKLARDVPELAPMVKKRDLNWMLGQGARVLVEVPQGYSLSVDNHLCYPYVTSRNCGVGQALSDAKIHPDYLGEVMMVLRTFPIRVGNIIDDNGEMVGFSGPHYQDQMEMTWEEVGQKPETTTVTGRVRRVFSFSIDQVMQSHRDNLPNWLFLNFANYLSPDRVEKLAWELHRLGGYDKMFLGHGPDVNDVESFLAQP